MNGVYLITTSRLGGEHRLGFAQRHPLTVPLIHCVLYEPYQVLFFRVIRRTATPLRTDASCVAVDISSRLGLRILCDDP